MLKYNWKDSTIPNIGNVKVNFINAPDLDSSILKQGDVRVFIKLPEFTHALPLITQRSNFVTNFIPTVGKIILYTQIITGTGTGEWNPITVQFRYIIIPGGSKVAARA